MALNVTGSAPGSDSGTSCTSDVLSVEIGNTVFVGIGWYDDTPRALTLEDNATGGTNTYTPCGALLKPPGHADVLRWYSAPVERDNAAFAVEATFDGDAGLIRMVCVVVTGEIDSIELYGGQGQSPGVTTPNGTTTGALGTPSEDGCLVLAISRSGAWPDNFDAGTGYTELEFINNNSGTCAEYLIQTTAAPVEATFTQDVTGNTVTLAVVIAPAGPPGGEAAAPLVNGGLVRGKLVGGLLLS